MPRTKLALSILLLLLVGAISRLRAEPTRQLKPRGYVNDFAEVLDRSTTQSIEQMCGQLEKKTGAQIAVVTVRSLDGASVENYAIKLFNEWGIGPKATNQGVLILLAMNEHRYRIQVGHGLQAILSGTRVTAFGQEVVPQLKEHRYGDALEHMTRRVAETIAAHAGVKLDLDRRETVG